MADVVATDQRCRSCGEVKALDEFDRRADTGGHHRLCKSCRRSYQRQRWECSSSDSRSSRFAGRSELYPCRLCGEMKTADEFPRRSRTSQYLQSWCKACFSKYKAERHVRLHEREMIRIRRNQKVYVARNVELVREYLETHPCVDCGETDPTVLDFDHLRDKEYDVSRLVYSGHPWERILREIAKCQVRCANDHRRATRKREQERRAARLAT